MLQLLKTFHWVVAGIGGGCVLACGALWFIYQIWTPTGIVCGVLGSLLLLLWVWLDLQQVRSPGQRASVKFALTSLLILMVAFGIVAVLQALSVRFDTRWDLTWEGRYSLSEHSQSVLSGLDEDVTVYAIFRKGTEEGETFIRMLRGAQAYSSHLELVEVDPLFDVALLRQVVQNEDERERGRLSEYGTAILMTGTARQRLDGDFSETAFINSLIRLESEERHQVCWSVGHGERSYEDQINPYEMGLLVSRMLDQNYVVRETRVVTEGIPKDCALLVVAGPQTDWIATEREALLEFIAYGGRALILVDPLIQGAQVDDFVMGLGVYGVAAGPDFVMEASRDHLEINEANEPLQFYYGSNFTIHPIVDVRDGMWAIQFGRSIRWEGTESGGQTGRTLIEASEMSWAEEDVEISAENPPSPDPGELTGRVGLGALVEITDPTRLIQDAPADARGRLVVFGDSDFASNQLSSLSRNGDIFLNAVSWLVGEEDQLGEREQGDAEFMVLTGVQMSIALLVALVLGPGGCLALGLWVFIRRRLG